MAGDTAAGRTLMQAGVSILPPPAHQKLSGCSTTGVQRAFLTTDRKDWLDAWWLVGLIDRAGPPKISRQSVMLSIAAMKLSRVRSRPAFSSAAMVKVAQV